MLLVTFPSFILAQVPWLIDWWSWSDSILFCFWILKIKIEWYLLIISAGDFCMVRKHITCGLFWHMLLVFYRIISWRKIHNLIRFRTKNFYHLDIVTLFSLKNTQGSKLVTVINILYGWQLSIYYYFLFSLLLADWQKIFLKKVLPYQVARIKFIIRYGIWN